MQDRHVGLSAILLISIIVFAATYSTLTTGGKLFWFIPISTFTPVSTGVPTGSTFINPASCGTLTTPFVCAPNPTQSSAIDALTSTNLGTTTKADFIICVGVNPVFGTYNPSTGVYTPGQCIPNLNAAYETVTLSSTALTSSVKTYWPTQTLYVHLSSTVTGAGSKYYDALFEIVVPPFLTGSSTPLYSLAPFPMFNRESAANTNIQVGLGLTCNTAFAGRQTAGGSTATAPTTGVPDCTTASTVRSALPQMFITLTDKGSCVGLPEPTIQGNSFSATNTYGTVTWSSGIGMIMAINSTSSFTMDSAWQLTANQPRGTAAPGPYTTWWANFQGVCLLNSGFYAAAGTLLYGTASTPGLTALPPNVFVPPSSVMGSTSLNVGSQSISQSIQGPSGTGKYTINYYYADNQVIQNIINKATAANAATNAGTSYAFTAVGSTAVVGAVYPAETSSNPSLTTSNYWNWQTA